MRNHGIDLLRLVLMYMVCVLHVLSQGGIIRASIDGSLGFSVFCILDIICNCAVDGFALISGYTAIDKPQKYSKLVNMWFQVFFYSFILTAIFTIVGLKSDFTIAQMIKSCFPVLFTKYWYFTAYFGLFLAMPVLNKFIFSIDKQTAKKAFIVICAVFSCMEILRFPFNTNNGYSFIWLIILYLIGGLIKKINLFEKTKSKNLILIWLICVLVSYGAYQLLGTNMLINYVSPTILLIGIIMVILFSRLKINSKIIQKLSPLAFGIYLLQLNSVLWSYLYDAFGFVVNLNIVFGFLCCLAIALGMFIAGLIVESLRVKLAKILRISKLSDYIVLFMNKTVNKLCVLLK